MNVFTTQYLMLGFAMLAAIMLTGAGVMGWISDRPGRCCIYLPAIVLGIVLGTAAIIASANIID